MAQSIMIDTKLRLVFETGLDGEGKPVYKTKTLSNVKKTATADQLFQVAQAITDLSNNPVVSAFRNDSYDIVG